MPQFLICHALRYLQEHASKALVYGKRLAYFRKLLVERHLRPPQERQPGRWISGAGALPVARRVPFGLRGAFFTEGPLLRVLVVRGEEAKGLTISVSSLVIIRPEYEMQNFVPECRCRSVVHPGRCWRHYDHLAI